MNLLNFNKYSKKLIYFSLLLAFVYGRYFGKVGFEDDFLKSNPTFSEIKKINDKQFCFAKTGNNEKTIVYTGTAQGYGGPLFAGIVIDSIQQISEVYILTEKETFGYLQKVKRKGFFKQFRGKKITDVLQPGYDIDAVSSCTVSSVAFSKAIKSAAVEACNVHGVEYSLSQRSWSFDRKFWYLLSVMMLGTIAFFVRKRWLRYLSLASGFIVIGFVTNSSISITNFGRIMLGYLPDPQEYIFWYLLMAFFIGFSLFAAKNVYCTTLCPFHAVQTALAQISGLRLRISPKIQKRAKFISGFLLWFAVFMIFISTNPVLGSYEPFALLFSLEGAGLQWYLLPVALFGALLVPDYYCHFFCPVGRTHKWLAGINRKVKSNNFLFRKNEIR